MEERMEKLRKLYGEISDEMQKWMTEDMERDARPAAYSIDESMKLMRSSYMWANDAAAQEKHYLTTVKPQLDNAGPKLDLVE